MRAVPISWIAKPGGSLSSIGLNVASANRRQHFGGSDRHIATKRQFIFSPGSMDLKHRNPPGVALFLIEFDEVIVIGQALAVSVEGKLPWAGLAERFFEFGAEADLSDSAGPSLAKALPLKSVTAQELTAAWSSRCENAECRFRWDGVR